MVFKYIFYNYCLIEKNVPYDNTFKIMWLHVIHILSVYYIIFNRCIKKLVHNFLFIIALLNINSEDKIGKYNRKNKYNIFKLFLNYCKGFVWNNYFKTFILSGFGSKNVLKFYRYMVLGSKTFSNFFVQRF